MSLVISRIFFQTNVLRLFTPQPINRTICRTSTSVWHDYGVFDNRQGRRLLVERIEFPILSLARSIQYSSLRFINQIEDGKGKPNKDHDATPPELPTSNSVAPPPKLSLIQKFKQMYKQYWYVLIPVHCFTSVFWAGGFYFAVKK